MIGKYTFSNLLIIHGIIVVFMFIGYVNSERRADNINSGTRAYVFTSTDTQDVLSWIERQRAITRRMY